MNNFLSCSLMFVLFESVFNLLSYSHQHHMLHFIRHAESEFNKVAENCQHRLGSNYLDSEEYLAEKFSHKYLDVEITQKGVQQARQAREIVSKLQVDIVLVSPMRRALHTCSIIFQNHPSKPAIIVEPSFRQIMESSNDIGSKVEESMQQYPSFNFQKITDKQAWFVSTLSNPQDKASILEKVQGLSGQLRKQAATEQCLKMMRQNWFERRNNKEQQEALKVRVLPDYEEQKAVLEFYAKKYQKIAIVAHSQCIKKYAGYKIKNCEVFSMSYQMLK